MNKFIQLTHYTVHIPLKPRWFHIDHIIQFSALYNAVGSQIIFYSGNKGIGSTIDVCETPEEILEKIKEAERDER